MNSPTPACVVKNTTVVRLSSGKYKELVKDSVVRYVAKYNLPSDHGFYDYDEAFFVVVYTKFGLAVINRQDLKWDYY